MRDVVRRCRRRPGRRLPASARGGGARTTGVRLRAAADGSARESGSSLLTPSPSHSRHLAGLLRPVPVLRGNFKLEHAAQRRLPTQDRLPARRGRWTGAHRAPPGPRSSGRRQAADGSPSWSDRDIRVCLPPYLHPRNRSRDSRHRHTHTHTSSRLTLR
jgi:hypothetical protein